MVPSRLQRASATQYRYLRSLYEGKHLSPPHRLRWYLLALVLAIYVAHFLNGDRGLLRRITLSTELKEVTADNARLRLQQERLIQEVMLKKDDPMSLERLAREKYWMIGPDERIYRFEDDEVVPEVAVSRGGDEAEDPEDEETPTH